MKMQSIVSAFLFCMLPLSLGDRARVTPVQRVLEMLNDMKAKGEKMMAEEKATFETYKTWVGDRSKDLGFEIIESERKIEELIAAIEKFNSDAEQLAAGIAELDADIARMDGEKKDATAVRDEQKTEFEKLEQDYGESVDALERAIQVLSTQAYDRPQAEAFLQRMTKTVPGMHRVLAAFLQQSATTDTREDGAPAVAAYEFQAGGIVEMLEGLLKKFQKEYDDTVTTEQNQEHYYQLEMLHLTDTITKSTADREEKAAAKAKATADSAQAQGELTDTRAALAEDKKFLADMTALFQSKSETFAVNQKVRADEIEAVSKAIEIISSPSVSESYAAHVKLAQLPSPTSFLQTARSKQRVAMRQGVQDFLARRAKSLSSQTLAGIAAQVSSSPFAKVIEMIESLITKLKEEAAAESAHKAWCDEELKKNKLKREKKTASVDKLTAEVDDLSSQIASMASQLETLAKEQADLGTAMSEATKQRENEKEENLAAIADAQAGTEAVKQALVVLREFYAAQASLVQVASGSRRQVPEMEEYKGMQGENGGVIGMLEVIQSDFERLEADTTAAEKQATREYDEFMADAMASKKQKHDTEVKMKLEKDQAEFEQEQTQKDLEAVQVELGEANKYYEELKPACLEVKVSYEERAQSRQQEIAALKEAYKMLETKQVE